MKKNIDKYYIRRTFKLAVTGEGSVSPNPLVGAVIVKDGRVIGEGYHRGKGLPHAEVEAIESANSDINGSTLYVSLEPCCHYGITPPCTELIISRGIGRVVAPIVDPNPRVNGEGFEILRNNGVQVTMGVLKEEARELNKFYLKYMKEGLPYVIMKAAMTLDGRIGNPDRNIYRITSDASIKEVHRYRNMVDAVLIGIDTVIEDNPLLTVRYGNKRNHPKKIIIDPSLETPLNSRLFNEGGEVIIATLKREADLGYPQCTIWNFETDTGIIPVKEILKKAGEYEITSIMVEGGSRTFTHFIKSEMVDRILLFYSPSLIGDGVPLLSGDVVRKLMKTNIRKMDNDILIEAEYVRGNN